ncbi:aminotransferase class V-fold PLP-dependent enzyme [Candidatus Solincola sp.]|nr:aminotransferase class V-fold PLP-dependent enzyme [Actinomycetota bacterium]MDI7253097.1 aminotransferase class V-fold PLP-dependent enzyme [Actinomycetota bacterium]
MSEDIYLDNAATTYPKPEAVYRAMDRFARQVGGNPGRSGHHRALDSGREVLMAREVLARLFQVDDPSRIIFTKNATEALNLVIQGRMRDGGHAVITSLEHNSVWRPMEALARRKGVTYTILECGADGSLNLTELREVITPETRLVACTHASNVSGALLPITGIAEVAAEKGVPLLVDAAQTAGRVEIHPRKIGIAYLVFTGHKELFGPQGTGGLYIAPGWEVEPLTYGGTGSRSESSLQPDFLPDRYESGTLNAHGLAGLRAGVEYVLETGIARIRRHERELTERLLEGLSRIPGAIVYGPLEWERRVGIVSFNLGDYSSSELASLLDEEYGICVRSGLHCSPLAHRTLGTLQRGVVRASLSYLNNEDDVDSLIQALRELSRR